MTHRTGTYYHSLSKTVPSGTKLQADGGDGPATKEVEVPRDSEITNIMVGWPASDGGVGINLSFEAGEQIFPRNDEDVYESTPSAFTSVFDTVDSDGSGIAVEEGEVLTGQFINYDTTNNKFATLMVGLKDVVGGDGQTDG